jgi:tRNA(Leu) C34 or U34 (ribose-2'-O)-methylase TrmL
MIVFVQDENEYYGFIGDVASEWEDSTKWKSISGADTQLTQAQIEGMGFSTTDNNTQLTQAQIEGMGFITTDNNTQRSDEEIRDVASAQWIDGINTTVVKDDGANTIKINSTDTGTQLSIGEDTDLVDLVDAKLVNGTNTTVVYDADNGTIKINSLNTDTNDDTQLTTEQVQDIMSVTLVGGTNTTVVYDDEDTGSITINSTDNNTQLTQAEIEEMGFSTTDTNTQRSDEDIRDVASAQWVNGINTTVVKDDGANTIKINSTDTNTQLTNEQVQDIMGGALVNGTNTTVVYDDNAGTIKINSIDTESDNNLNLDLKPNIDVGGISTSDTFEAGDDIEALLRKLLIQYQKSVLSSLTISNNGSIINPNYSSFEAGESIPYDSVSFTATQDDPNGDFPTTVSFKDDSGTTIATESNITANNALSISEQTLSPTDDIPATGKTVNIKLEGKSGDGSTSIQLQKSFHFRWKNYLCASSIDLKNESNKAEKVATILSDGLIRSALDTNKSWSPVGDSNTQSTSNYTYIMYPSNYGGMNSILFNNAGLDQSGAFSLITTLEIENDHGSKLQYKIYQSNATGVVLSSDRLYIN